MLTFFSTLATRLADWRRREAARAELEQLDDRTLADIGIRRSDIPFVFERGYRPGQPELTVGPARPANANARPRAVA